MAPLSHIDSSDLQTILADALTSFSPLATLVGAESARSFAHQATNYKQHLFSVLAPIGALGMCASICKASDLPGLKTMLGATDSNIYDAAAELGGFVLLGLIPQLTPSGGMNCQQRKTNKGEAASAIVKLAWNPSGAIDFDQAIRVVTDFQFGMITGRVVWNCGSSKDDFEGKARLAREALHRTTSAGNLIYRDPDGTAMFQDLDSIPDGQGIIELHWPAPSMSLETNQWIVYTALFLSIAAFATVAGVTASPRIHWQTPLSSGLLFGGQILLASGQLACHVFVKRARVTPKISLPSTGVAPTWTLVDNIWFVTALARRPWARGSSTTIEIGQYQSFHFDYIPQWQGLLAVAALVCGFIPFYAGARASDTRTVALFIAIFLIVHITKGWVLGVANQCYYSRTMSFGAAQARTLPYISNHIGQYAPTNTHKVQSVTVSAPPQPVVLVDPLLIPLPDSQISLVQTPSPTSTSSPTTSTHPPSITPKLASPSQITLPPSSSSLTTGSPPSTPHLKPQLPPSPEYRLYLKTLIRHRESIDTFYFPRNAEWAVAAHIVYNTTLPFLDWRNVGATLGNICEIPIITQDIHALLLLATDIAYPENTWWIACQEVVSILMSESDAETFNPSSLPSASMFTSSTYLPSESLHVADLCVLKECVKIIARMLIMDNGLTGGARNIMQSIELVRAKRDYNGSLWFVSELKQAAQEGVDGVRDIQRTQAV